MTKKSLDINVFLEGCLVAFACLVYLLTHFMSLKDFPSYFLYDEAVQALLASELVSNKFFSSEGKFLPLYFPVASWDWSISTSVYILSLPLLIFKPSILLVRLISAVIGLLVPLCVALTLRNVFRLKTWGLSILILSLIPTWFLHSRTALVVPFMVSFYTLFVAGYLHYRNNPNSRTFWFSAVGGAGAFYSYSAGQIIVPMTLMLFVLSDLMFHIRHWKMSLKAIVAWIIIFLPAAIFRFNHPDLLYRQLNATNSPLAGNYTTAELLKFLGSNYLSAIDPFFWFVSTDEIVRHRMAGYGHLPYWIIPFLVIGVVYGLRHFARPQFRSIFIMAIVTLMPAMLTFAVITRTQAFVVPCVFFAAIGIDRVILFAGKYISYRILLSFCFTLLGILSWRMYKDSVENGAKWFNDYELYGLQWGTKELYEHAIPEFIAQNEQVRLHVSPHWANGGDIFVDFFNLKPRVIAGGPEAFIDNFLQIPDDLVLVVTRSEFERIIASNKFEAPQVLKEVPYPDGRTGFYFVKLKYRAGAEELFKKEAEERKKPQVGTVTLRGVTAEITYSRADMGEPSAIFDGNTETLLRGLEANPFILDIIFESPLEIKQVKTYCRNPDHVISAELYQGVDTNERPIHVEAQASKIGDHSEAIANFQPVMTKRMHIEILDREFQPGQQVKMHLYELGLN